jgi:hypothetical protein
MAVLPPAAIRAQQYADDFMFHQPKATLHVNLGYGLPKAGSDLFDKVTSELTLDKGDFRALVLGGGLSFFLDERIDLALEVSFSRSSPFSEWAIGPPAADGLPIEQETEFTRVPVTASIRYFLTDRGRSVGTLSWIPVDWAPYIGLGGGRIWYEFSQTGEFVDLEDPECETLGCPIYPGTLSSSGSGWLGQAFAGVQWALSPQWVLVGEGRYSFADAELDRPTFSGYDPIDLSGFQATVGFGVRF